MRTKSVFARFTKEGREVYTLATEFAKERVPGGRFTVTVADVRRALMFRGYPGRGGVGGQTEALTRRISSIDGPIGPAELRRALS